MKLIFTSDLHYPITKWDLIQKLAKDIAGENPRALVLGGDIGETVRDHRFIIECIELFVETVGCPILVFAGNHDLWVSPDSKIDSRQIWESKFRKWVEAAGARYLEDQNFLYIEEDGRTVAVVGSYLHCDYSTKDTIGAVGNLPDDYFWENKKRFINDGVYMRGLPNDREFAGEIGRGFLARLHQTKTADAVVVCTHNPAVEELIIRRPHDTSWAMSTPYFGNISYQKELAEMKNLKYIISGHTHVGRRTTFNGMPAVSLDVDYNAPAYEVIDVHNL